MFVVFSHVFILLSLLFFSLFFVALMVNLRSMFLNKCFKDASNVFQMVNLQNVNKWIEDNGLLTVTLC